jgi:hypothetical protein
MAGLVRVALELGVLARPRRLPLRRDDPRGAHGAGERAQSTHAAQPARLQALTLRRPWHQVEVAINELAVVDGLGGASLARRALAVALLARLACLLQPGGHCETQLSIIVKNIAGAAPCAVPRSAPALRCSLLGAAAAAAGQAHDSTERIDC